MLHINHPDLSLGLRVSSDSDSYQYMNFGATNGYSIGRASDDKFFINRDEPLGSGVLRALTIQPDGKVGIGTSNPSTKLEVAGDFKVNGYILSEEIQATYSYLGPVIEGLNESSPITIIWDRKIGVYGSADSGYGGYFRTKNNGAGWDIGVHGQANSERGTGVYGEASGFSGINYGVFGVTKSSSGYGGFFEGRGYFSDKVGIGTKSPAEMLHINKSSGSLGMRVSSDAASYQYMNFGATNGYSIGRTPDEKFFINREEPLGYGALRILTIQSDGKVGIGTPNPAFKLDVEGTVQAHAFDTGDITFRKDSQILWRMFEDEKGLYLEKVKTGKVYSFVLQETENETNVRGTSNLEEAIQELQTENEALKKRLEALERTIQKERLFLTR
jgi:hypothetical protein